MANGKPGDNPLTDLLFYDQHPFPPEIEELLLRVQALAADDRWPLGENRPYSMREFAWEKGEDLEAASRDLKHLIAMLEAGRGDEVLVVPFSQKPFISGE